MTITSVSTSIAFTIGSSKKPASSPLAVESPISLDFHKAGLANMKVLDGAESTKPLNIESANREVAKSMAQSTRTCEQKANSIGLRMVGGALGAVRAVGLFFWSPITALKYLFVALVQLCKGEFAKAGVAMALAVTAPMWAPLDGAYKTYRRFALYGDEKLSSLDRAVYKKCEKTWLEKFKEVAKEDVIDPDKGWLDGGSRHSGSLGGLAMCAGSCAC